MHAHDCQHLYVKKNVRQRGYKIQIIDKSATCCLVSKEIFFSGMFIRLEAELDILLTFFSIQGKTIAMFRLKTS